MPGDSNGDRGLEGYIDITTADRLNKIRLEFERELSEIDARSGIRRTTLQEDEALIRHHQAIVQELRTRTQASEAVIRASNARTQILRQQCDNDNKRREEISRILLPEGWLEKRLQTRREVRADFIIQLRSDSLEPLRTHQTATQLGEDPANTPIQGRQPALQDIREEHDEDLRMLQHEPRRSRRNRTVRYHSEPRSPSPEPGFADTGVLDTAESSRGAGREKRSRPTDDESHTDAHGRKKSRLAAREPIEYDEVFGNGNAKIKYNIVEYPKDSGKWYILRCLKHNKHFFRGALQAGAKHLSGKLHKGRRDWDLAFKFFHVQVLNCDAAKAERNNLAVRQAVASGYAGPRATRTTKKARRAQIQRHRLPPSIVVSNQPSPSVQPTFVPTVGQIYRISWLGKPALAVVLPIGDLSVVGMTGPAVTAVGIRLPGCYRFQRKRGAYEWDYHYRDGHERVEHRKYPILAFRRGMEIPKFPEPFFLPFGVECYDFLKPCKLTTVNMHDPEVRKMEGYEPAKAFHERMEAWRGTRDRNYHDEAEGFDDDSAESDSDCDQEAMNMDSGGSGHGCNDHSAGAWVIPTSPQPDIEPPTLSAFTSPETSSSGISLETPEDVDAFLNEVPKNINFGQDPERAIRTDEPDSSSGASGHGKRPDRRLSTGEHDPTAQVALGLSTSQGGPSTSTPSTTASRPREHVDQPEDDWVMADGLPRFDPGDDSCADPYSGNTKGTIITKPWRAPVADMGGGVDKSGMPMRTIDRAHTRVPAGEGYMADDGQAGSTQQVQRRRSA